MQPATELWSSSPAVPLATAAQTTVLVIAFHLLLLGITGFGVFMTVHPERAYRYENFWTLRSVELSEYGEMKQVWTGRLGVILCGLAAAALTTRHWLYPASFAAVAVGSYLRFRPG